MADLARQIAEQQLVDKGYGISHTTGRKITWVDSYQNLPFPHHVYPPNLAAYIQAVAASVCVHPDMVAAMCLPVASAAAGNSHTVGVKDDWQEAPRLWVAIVADPGGGKSPAQDRVVKGLARIEHELDATYQVELAQHESLDDRQKKATHLPAPKRITADDVTVEVLARIIQNQPRGLLLDKDELSGWVAAFGEYKPSAGGDRQRWLSLWSGKTIRTERVSLGAKGIIVPRPFVAIVGGIQPEKVDLLAGKAGDDGMLYRFLLCAPPEQQQSARTPSVPAQLSAGWADICHRLWKLECGPTPTPIPVTPDGRERMLDELDRIYQERADEALQGPLRGFWAKAPAHYLRTAALLAMLWHVDSGVELEVTEPVAEWAAMLSDYFKGQAVTMFGPGGTIRPIEYTRANPNMEQKLLRWLEQQTDRRARMRQAMREPLQYLTRKDALDVVQTLEARGAIELEDGPRNSTWLILR